MWQKAAGILVALVAIVSPGAVFAHATPVTYTPAAGVTELSTPSLISIRFTERIEVGASSIKVYGPDGSEVGIGKGEPDPNDGRVFNVSLAGGVEGVYTVSWQVVSVDDGHFTKGAYSFLVDSEGKAFEGDAGGTVAIFYVTSFTEAVLHFFGLVGESLFLGLLAVLLFLLKPLYIRRGVTDDEREQLEKVFAGIAVFGAAALALSCLIIIGKKTNELAVLQEIGFMSALPLYLASSAGFSYFLKMCIALSLGLLLVLSRGVIFASSKWTWPEYIGIILLAALLYLQSQSSHAAASHFFPEIAVGVTIFHLFAKELVIGALMVILVYLSVLLGGGFLRMLPLLLARYDVLAALAVLIAGVSGAYVSWLHLKSFSHLHTTEWGERFLVLLMFTLLLGTFRVFHQFILHPLVRKHSGARHLLRFTMPLEVLMGLAVLFISGYISITTPPFTVEEYTYQNVVNEGGDRVVLEAHPYDTESMRITYEGVQDTAPRALTLILTNSTLGIGPNVLHPEERFPGGYAFPKTALMPPGSWDIEAVLTEEGTYDRHARFTLTYPDDIAATKRSDNDQGYDAFAEIFIGFATLIVLMSLVLLTHALIRTYRESKLRDADLVRTEDTLIPIRFLTIFGGVILLACSYFLYATFIQTEFERICLREGYEWQQAFPARDAAATSPNAISGCTVHGGHFHFVDLREYRASLKPEVGQ